MMRALGDLGFKSRPWLRQLLALPPLQVLHTWTLGRCLS